MIPWLLLVLFFSEQTTGKEWSLVWNDEFDKPNIDDTLWNYDLGDACETPAGCGWGNGEKQYFTNSTENAFVENGRLIIQAKKERVANSDYTSARMKTFGKGDWKFGKIEVRAKFPRGEGLLPHIWLLPTYEVYGNWPASGHIDIAVMYNLDKVSTHDIYGTVIYGPTWANKISKTFIYSSDGKIDFTETFNVFSLEWEKDRVRWFVNGVNFHEEISTHGGFNWYPFNQKFHLLLSFSVGGNGVGNFDSTGFPKRFEFDYVRVYQKL